MQEFDPQASIHDIPADPVRGLSSAEAQRRLLADGPNSLDKTAPISPLAIFAAQFGSIVIWILIGAALISLALGEIAEGVSIIVIVVINAAIGFAQEFRAENAAAALARLTAPRARVIRDGGSVIIPAAGVVVGDILVLEGGDLVAADARLLDCASLRTNEAPLTGESEPVDKHSGDLAPETPLAERRNMVFLGTSIVNGTGHARVVATGMRTEMGRIADLLHRAGRDQTPLQRRLDRVGRHLLWACLGIVLFVFMLGLLRSVPIFDLFLSAVSLAVAAIPEGLPAAVTVALALGVQRMVRRNALVRRLQAVETLGCAQVICTDKTGTLTVGQMTARKIVTADAVYGVTGEGYGTIGEFIASNRSVPPASDPALLELLRAAVACNDSELVIRDAQPVMVGDPTEGALLIVAAKAGIGRADIEAALPRMGVVPFDSDRKRMTVIRQTKDGPAAFVKGAPETVLARCTRIRTAGGIRPMTEALHSAMDQAVRMLAEDALRVLAIAERPDISGYDASSGVLDAEQIESGLILLGFIGLQDPPRAEARAAVNRCQRAGIRVVMITGDHPDTARAIARELGILGTGDDVCVGVDLANMPNAELEARIQRIAVYARVTAEDKLRIVRAWKARGAVVAMTGDGVNDAPAIKEASIGIAMGQTGTEVTKEASDIIITDDNFASIVAAVEEGRGIYDNIRKTLSYLLAGNSAELFVMLFAALLAWPLPLLPLHLLWINLVTDGLPALALATDPIDTDVLERPPRDPRADLLDREFVQLTLLTGAITAAVALGAFAFEYLGRGDLGQARDAAFTALVIAELCRSFGARSSSRTVWQMGLFSNMRLFLIVSASFAIQIAIHHIEVLQTLFDIEPLSMHQCIAWIAAGFIPLLALELRKVFIGRRALGHAGRLIT